MKAWMLAHGIHYHTGRWKAHRADLAHEAGVLGFDVGRAWEQTVRTWLETCYGPRFFAPQRWLLIHTRSGAKQYREVDGVERVDATQAFVYEIKHGEYGYFQLAEEYLPLLQHAYPTRLFTPIEINSVNPYSPAEAQRWQIHPIAGLEDRVMNGQYQLLILPEALLQDEEYWDEDEEDEEDDAEEDTATRLLPHLWSLRCRRCGGGLWQHQDEIYDYLDVTQAHGVPQTLFAVAEMLSWCHAGRGACASCVPDAVEL
jgi:hypothetical protein